MIEMTTATDITIVDKLADNGPLTVKELTALLGKAETTVRTMLKGLVDAEVVIRVEGSKPAAYRISTAPVETETVEVVEIEDTPAIDEIGDAVAETETETETADNDGPPYEDEEEAKLNDLLDAITAIEPAPAPKVKKSRKVGHTQVPDEHNVTIRRDGELLKVTQAYALLIAVPTFNSVAEVLEMALTAEQRLEGDHSPHEIAALYYRTVAEYLELLLDEEAITRPVWYGRTCRLRHLVIGHGRGTAAAKPVVKISDK